MTEAEVREMEAEIRETERFLKSCAAGSHTWKTRPQTKECRCSLQAGKSKEINSLLESPVGTQPW